MKPQKGVQKAARKIIGEYLELIKEEKKIKPFELSANFQIPIKNISKVLDGKKYNFDTLLEILQALDMRIELMPKNIEKSFPKIKRN